MQKKLWTKNVFTITDVFSKEECQKYINHTEKIGFTDAPINTNTGAVVSPEVRNNTRVMFDDKDIAKKLWERVKTFVPEKYKGRKFLGLNERFRFYKYDQGQRFAPHADGYYTRENGERSLFTFMIYLNEDYKGGETKFFYMPLLGRKKEFVIKPQTGMALLFEHTIIHEGATVITGRKYVLRSDIMYTK
ncbi:prolyl hydroxylase family protein [Candidatus Uabimicrobium sp. HlEnr_7]|uniref:prolyl hydroxylase family protein n=1 Tax=Candidatus Uabimicrobium helgolandensis TaxID=3095367 RepID=UPI003558A6CA